MVLKERADVTRPQMGMLSWNAEEPLQRDALSPQSYLAPAEFRELNSVTVILLDVFSDQLELGRLTKMADVNELLDRQLRLLNRPVLRHGGSVSTKDAEAHARAEYMKFDADRKAKWLAAETSALEELKKVGTELPRAPRKPRGPQKK